MKNKGKKALAFILIAIALFLLFQAGHMPMIGRVTSSGVETENETTTSTSSTTTTTERIYIPGEEAACVEGCNGAPENKTDQKFSNQTTNETLKINATFSIACVNCKSGCKSGGDDDDEDQEGEEDENKTKKGTTTTISTTTTSTTYSTSTTSSTTSSTTYATTSTTTTQGTTTTSTSTTFTSSTTTSTSSTTSTTLPCGYLKIFKYNDTNANREWDEDENTLGNFTFNITGETSSGTVNYTGTTTRYGEIFLNCIPYGNYTVIENVPAGWTVTTDNPQNISIDKIVLQEVRFGNKQTTTTTTTMGTTTTTIPNAGEFTDNSAALLILLLCPAFAYLAVKRE